MKKNLSISSLCAMLIVSLLFSLNSCKSDSSADISDLLSTVPNDASAVAAFNLRSIVEKTGSKIDGSKVVPGKELSALIENSGKSSGFSRFFTKDYGIEPETAVIFVEGQDTYLSGYLARPESFRKAVEEETSSSFTKENDVETCGNYAMKGNQFWQKISHRNSISASEISRFTSLSEKLSFLSGNYGETLSELDHDIKGWGNITGMFNVAQLDFQSKSMARMAIESIFTDAEDLAFHVDFEKGKMSSSMLILNSKGKPAKFNFPAEKIDVSVVKHAGTSADMILAMAISPKMIEQLKEQTDGKGISVLGMVLPALSSIDGTAVIEGRNGAHDIAGVISTKGEGTAPLSDLLTSALECTVTKDGRLLRFSRGTVAGRITNEEAADKLKGAIFGLVTTTDGFGDDPAENPIDNVAVTLTSHESSIRLNAIAEGKEKKENILLSLIKSKI